MPPPKEKQTNLILVRSTKRKVKEIQARETAKQT